MEEDGLEGVTPRTLLNNVLTTVDTGSLNRSHRRNLKPKMSKSRRKTETTQGPTPRTMINNVLGALDSEMPVTRQMARVVPSPAPAKKQSGMKRRRSSVSRLMQVATTNHLVKNSQSEATPRTLIRNVLATQDDGTPAERPEREMNKTALQASGTDIENNSVFLAPDNTTIGEKSADENSFMRDYPHPSQTRPSPGPQLGSRHMHLNTNRLKTSQFLSQREFSSLDLGDKSSSNLSGESFDAHSFMEGYMNPSQGAPAESQGAETLPGSQGTRLGSRNLEFDTKRLHAAKFVQSAQKRRKLKGDMISQDEATQAIEEVDEEPGARDQSPLSEVVPASVLSVGAEETHIPDLSHHLQAGANENQNADWNDVRDDQPFPEAKSTHRQHDTQWQWSVAHNASRRSQRITQVSVLDNNEEADNSRYSSLQGCDSRRSTLHNGVTRHSLHGSYYIADRHYDTSLDEEENRRVSTLDRHSLGRSSHGIYDGQQYEEETYAFQEQNFKSSSSYGARDSQRKSLHGSAYATEEGNNFEDLDDLAPDVQSLQEEKSRSSHRRDGTRNSLRMSVVYPEDILDESAPQAMSRSSMHMSAAHSKDRFDEGLDDNVPKAMTRSSMHRDDRKQRADSHITDELAQYDDDFVPETQSFRQDRTFSNMTHHGQFEDLNGIVPESQNRTFRETSDNRSHQLQIAEVDENDMDVENVAHSFAENQEFVDKTENRKRHSNLLHQEDVDLLENNEVFIVRQAAYASQARLADVNNFQSPKSPYINRLQSIRGMDLEGRSTSRSMNITNKTRQSNSTYQEDDCTEYEGNVVEVQSHTINQDLADRQSFRNQTITDQSIPRNQTTRSQSIADRLTALSPRNQTTPDRTTPKNKTIANQNFRNWTMDVEISPRSRTMTDRLTARNTTLADEKSETPRNTTDRQARNQTMGSAKLGNQSRNQTMMDRLTPRSKIIMSGQSPSNQTMTGQQSRYQTIETGLSLSSSTMANSMSPKNTSSPLTPTNKTILELQAQRNQSINVEQSFRKPSSPGRLTSTFQTSLPRNKTIGAPLSPANETMTGFPSPRNQTITTEQSLRNQTINTQQLPKNQTMNDRHSISSARNQTINETRAGRSQGEPEPGTMPDMTDEGSQVAHKAPHPGTIESYFGITRSQPGNTQLHHPKRAPLNPLPAKSRIRRTTIQVGKSKRQKERVARIPAAVTKSIFTHFSRCRVPRAAWDTVQEIADEYWSNITEDLAVLVSHAGRHTVHRSDMELLMKRQGFVNDKESLHSLIEKYLPLEYRQELIPIARAGNKVVPSG